MSNNFTSIDLNGVEYQLEIREQSNDNIFLVYVRKKDDQGNYLPWEPLDSTVEVATIAERDALTIAQNGVTCYVIDASDDPEIASGPAAYLYADSQWRRIYPGTTIALNPGKGFNADKLVNNQIAEILLDDLSLEVTTNQVPLFVGQYELLDFFQTANETGQPFTVNVFGEGNAQTNEYCLAFYKDNQDSTFTILCANYTTNSGFFSWVFVQTNTDPTTLQDGDQFTQDGQLSFHKLDNSINDFAAISQNINGLLLPQNQGDPGSELIVTTGLSGLSVTKFGLKNISQGGGGTTLQAAQGIDEDLLSIGFVGFKPAKGASDVNSLDVSISGTPPAYEGNYAMVGEGIIYEVGANLFLVKLGNPNYDNNATKRYAYYSYFDNTNQGYYIFAKQYSNNTSNWQWRILHLGSVNPFGLSDFDVINIDNSQPGREWTAQSATEAIPNEQNRANNGFTEPPQTDQTSDGVVILFSTILNLGPSYIINTILGAIVQASTSDNLLEDTDKLLVRSAISKDYITEQKLPGVFYDGKQVYRRVIEFSSLTQISVTGIDKVIDQSITQKAGGLQGFFVIDTFFRRTVFFQPFDNSNIIEILDHSGITGNNTNLALDDGDGLVFFINNNSGALTLYKYSFTGVQLDNISLGTDGGNLPSLTIDTDTKRLYYHNANLGGLVKSFDYNLSDTGNINTTPLLTSNIIFNSNPVVNGKLYFGVGNEVRSMDLDGSNQVVLFTQSGASAAPSVDTNYIYIVEGLGVQRYDLDGTNKTSIGGGLGAPISNDDNYIYGKFSTSGLARTDAVTGGNDLTYSYTTNFANGGIQAGVLSVPITQITPFVNTDNQIEFEAQGDASGMFKIDYTKI